MPDSTPNVSTVTTTTITSTFGNPSAPPSYFNPSSYNMLKALVAPLTSDDLGPENDVMLGNSNENLDEPIPYRMPTFHPPWLDQAVAAANAQEYDDEDGREETGFYDDGGYGDADGINDGGGDLYGQIYEEDEDMFQRLHELRARLFDDILPQWKEDDYNDDPYDIDEHESDPDHEKDKDI